MKKSLTERSLTKAEIDKSEEIIKKLKGNKKDFVKRYGKDAEAVMYGRAVNMAKKQVENMEGNKLKEMIKKALSKPQVEGKKVDMDKDGDIDSKDYLLKRDQAIKKSKGEMKEGELEEAYVPSNIKEFAKRKGATSLVNKVAGWAEKAGKGIRGGTAIGKDYSTLILDLSYQDGAIRINLDDDTVTLYDEEIFDAKSFKQVYLANQEESKDSEMKKAMNETSGSLRIEKQKDGKYYWTFTFASGKVEKWPNGFATSSDAQKDFMYRSKYLKDSSMNEANGFKSGKEFINIKLKKYPKSLAKVNNLISMIGENNFTMEMAEWINDFFNNASYESPMNEDLDLGHTDNEPHMIKGELYQISKNALDLYDMVSDYEGRGEVDFPAWWQSKITTAKNMMAGTRNYLEFELEEPNIDNNISFIDDSDMLDEGMEDQKILDNVRSKLLSLFQPYGDFQILDMTMKGQNIGTEFRVRAKSKGVDWKSLENFMRNNPDFTIKNISKQTFDNPKTIDFSYKKLKEVNLRRIIKK